MRLKTWTTTILFLGIAALLAGPFIVGRRPALEAPRRELQLYAARYMGYVGLLLLLFFALFVLAWLVLRQAREEFRERSRENLDKLIEGTLSDHGKPK